MLQQLQNAVLCLVCYGSLMKAVWFVNDPLRQPSLICAKEANIATELCYLLEGLSPPLNNISLILMQSRLAGLKAK